jgi:hypothetical protein
MDYEWDAGRGEDDDWNSQGLGLVGVFGHFLKEVLWISKDYSTMRKAR